MTRFSNLCYGLIFLMLINAAYAQSQEINENNLLMDTTITTGGLTCQLTGAALQNRLNELKLEIFTSVKKIDEVENGFVFLFQDDNDFILKLTDYVLSERVCCPFFQFDLSFQANQGGIVLQISGPPEAKEMIGMFIEEVVKK